MDEPVHAPSTPSPAPGWRDIESTRPPPLAYGIADMVMRYVDPVQRGSVRRGMGDAAHLCDAIASQIASAGRKSKRRDEMVAVAKRCGDAIWAMRELVCPDEWQPAPPSPTPPQETGA